MVEVALPWDAATLDSASKVELVEWLQSHCPAEMLGQLKLSGKVKSVAKGKKAPELRKAYLAAAAAPEQLLSGAKAEERKQGIAAGVAERAAAKEALEAKRAAAAQDPDDHGPDADDPFGGARRKPLRKQVRDCTMAWRGTEEAVASGCWRGWRPPLYDQLVAMVELCTHEQMGWGGPRKMEESLAGIDKAIELSTNTDCMIATESNIFRGEALKHKETIEAFRAADGSWDLDGIDAFFADDDFFGATMGKGEFDTAPLLPWTTPIQGNMDSAPKGMKVKQNKADVKGGGAPVRDATGQYTGQFKLDSEVASRQPTDRHWAPVKNKEQTA